MGAKIKTGRKDAGVGARLKTWREERRCSIRALARLAGVSPSLVSKIEAGKVSPTVATMQKLVEAMASDLHEFFRGGTLGDASEQVVFKRDSMVVSQDRDRVWRFAFPRHPAIHAQLTYEEYQPHTKLPEKERHWNDVFGYVLAGELTLHVHGRGGMRVVAGDAFYVRAGRTHAARNDGDAVLKLVAVQLR